MAVYYIDDQKLWFNDVKSQEMGGTGSFLKSPATGQITVKSPGTSLAVYEQKSITLTDTNGHKVIFRFMIQSYQAASGERLSTVTEQVSINISSATTKIDIANEILTAINQQDHFELRITASLTTISPNPVLTLTQGVGGKAGNTDITEDIGNTDILTVANFSNGGGFCSGGPMLRIGMQIPQQQILPGDTPINANDAVGNRVGKVTLLGGSSRGDFQDISYLDGYVQGKDVKNMTQFFKMNLPLVRSNNCQYYKSQKLSGEIDHTLSITRDIALGQADGTRRTLSALPYNDVFVKGYDPVDYIRAGKYVIGYPIVTDNIFDYENYNDPDALHAAFAGGHFRDGTIEPLGIRNSFANPNTSNPNILLAGIKGSFMPHHQEQGDYSDGKGSCMISDEIEFRQGPYDWFEDAQDQRHDKKVFSRVGDIHWEAGVSATDRFYSLDGYVSDGEYLSAPFVDESVDQKYFSGKYRQLSSSAAADLLKNSSKTLSNIGSRFKSSTRGIIIDPKKDSINQLVTGTDSYAFVGLIRS